MNLLPTRVSSEKKDAPVAESQHPARQKRGPRSFQPPRAMIETRIQIGDLEVRAVLATVEKGKARTVEVSDKAR